MLLRKKRKKKKTVLILKTNKKKGFKFHVRIALFTEKQTFYGIKICFNILVLYLML